MRFSDTNQPSGTIIVPMGSLGRFDEFYTALEAVQVPHRTLLLKGRSAEIARSLNQMIAQMRGEWVWILGDDHPFAPDTLLELLNRQAGAIVPRVCCRLGPFPPVVWHGPLRERQRYTWKELNELPECACLPLGDLVGNAGLLLRKAVLTEVWERTKRPFFEVGQVESDCLHEDLYFADKLAQLGIPIYYDRKARLGHTTVMTVWPADESDQSISYDGVMLEVGTDNYPMQVFL